jgi:hypothetical protein
MRSDPSLSGAISAPLAGHSVDPKGKSPVLGFGVESFFGPLGHVDNPTIVGDFGMQYTGKQGLHGSASASDSIMSVLPTEGASTGAGLSEARPAVPPSSRPASVVSSKKKVGGKLKKPKKISRKLERPYSRLMDDITDDEDRKDDDRIMELLELGATDEIIDRLYCVENLSVNDVERPCIELGLIKFRDSLVVV